MPTTFYSELRVSIVYARICLQPKVAFPRKMLYVYVKKTHFRDRPATMDKPGVKFQTKWVTMEIPEPSIATSTTTPATAPASGGRPTKTKDRKWLPGLFSELEYVSVLMRIHELRSSDLTVAARALKHFGSLMQLMMTPESELAAHPDVGPNAAANLAAARKLMVEAAYSPLANVPVVRTYDQLFQYLQWSTPRDSVERVRLLSLGPTLALIKDEVVAQGTSNFVACSTKMILKRAIQAAATSIILVHNHPSGSVEPSGNDIELTEDLAIACGIVELYFYDHIIIAGGKWFSFKQNNRMPRSNRSY